MSRQRAFFKIELCYRSFPFEQIMGMGFQSLSVGNFPTTFQTLINQDQVEKPMFAFYLSSSGDVDGELVLGGYDSNHFKVRRKLSLLLLVSLSCSRLFIM